jgi:hypothetical protein
MRIYIYQDGLTACMTRLNGPSVYLSASTHDELADLIAVILGADSWRRIECENETTQVLTISS